MFEMTEEGYIFCVSNESTPGMIYINYTDPHDICLEMMLVSANAPCKHWQRTAPYKIAFAKKVSDAEGKTNTISALLETYKTRNNPSREFRYDVSLIHVRKLFDLMDGEMWIDPNSEDYPLVNDDDEEDEEDEDEEDEEDEDDEDEDEEEDEDEDEGLGFRV